jgi:hypothetical protein
MKTFIAVLAAVALLAVAAPAGAMPIDNYRSIPSEAPLSTAPSSGTETWVVIAAAALAFAAGTGAARLAPAVRLRMGAS